jgi:hypothetical protein
MSKSMKAMREVAPTRLDDGRLIVRRESDSIGTINETSRDSVITKRQVFRFDQPHPKQ